MTIAASPVEARSGIRILPDRTHEAWWGGRQVSTIEGRPPAESLDETLAAIAERYGTPTDRIVAMQLEYSKADRTP